MKRQSIRAAVLCFSCSAVAALGCRPAPSAPGSTVGNVTPDVHLPEELAVVPSQTPFTVELATQIRSDETHAGEPFRARVLSPLNTADGKVVVPLGARVTGHIVGIVPSPPTVYLQFDEVETTWGSRPITASLVSDQPIAGVEVLPGGPDYAAALRRFSGLSLSGRSVGGGPPPESSERVTPQILLLPGSRLRLFLTAPLVVRSTTSPPAPFAP